jgi:Predicted hydrolase (metallo-beta-lactamase superfamily)
MKHYLKLFSCLFVLCIAAVSCTGKSSSEETTAETSAAPQTASETEAETSHSAAVYSPDGSVIAGNSAGSGTVDEFKVYYINVGRADATLIDAGGKYYLIDTGEADDAEALCEKLDSLGVQTIEAVFLTHTHSDHIGGFKKICKEFDVGGLFSPCFSILNDDGNNIIDKLAKKCGKVNVKLYRGDSVSLCDGVYAKVLGPIVYNGDDDNDNSLVLRIAVNGRIFLFVGDMQFAEEYTLLQAGDDLSADVLKVGNHGNKDATSSAFASAVSPSIAVIPTDTAVDAESAAKRVLEEFTDSEIFITGECKNWLLVSVLKNGELSALPN